MKIVAVAKEGNGVSGHFGYCDGFQLYNVEGGSVSNSTFVENPGHRPGFLPKFLAEKDVNVIIAGGMGSTAQELFNENNIEVIVGASGNVDNAVTNYATGNLKSSGSICREHNHEDDHH